MRILIVDDHQVVRRGVRSLLESEMGFEVCGEAVDGHDAIQKASESLPDVIVMDISMPNMNGIVATREISRRLPNTRIVILSQHDNREMMKQALDAGARAYVVKSAISTDLVAALEKISESENAVNSTLFGSAQDNLDVQEVLQRSITFENELRESEERFRLTFEQAAVGIAHVGLNGRFLRVNQRLCDVLGYNAEELRDVMFQDVTYPSDLAADLELRARILSGELDHYSREKRYVRKDQAIIWTNLTVSAVRNPQMTVKYFIAVIEDISVHKRAEQELAEKASLLELSSDAIVMRDATDRITYWSAGATEVYGYTREEALGRATHDLLATVFPEPLEDIKQKLLETGRWSGELLHTRKDGSKIGVSSRWCLARNDNGDVGSILETNRDITAELALKKLLQETADHRPPAEHSDANAANTLSKATAVVAPSA
ncbi:MAG TPA: PAS domain S-box protein [Candidatus Acidoferrum sp.]|nr:PAS domain S-box protein [Candidatus Acidoferrum sp.]